MDLGEGVSGPEAKNLKRSPKSLPGLGRKSLKKVSKRARKVKKNLRMGFLKTFQTFFETLFFDFWGPARDQKSRGGVTISSFRGPLKLIDSLYRVL